MVKKGDKGHVDSERRYGTFIPKSGNIELMDIDYAILRLLPPVGTRVGKYLPDAPTSNQVTRKLDDATLKASLVAGRLRQLRAAGYATPIKTVGGGNATGGGKGWQRTAEGTKFLQELDGQAPTS